MTRLKDRLAEVVITAGGLSVLLAMLGICVFLVAEAAPLLRGGSADPAPVAAAMVEGGAPAIARLLPDSPRALLLDGSGTLRTVNLPDGRVLAEQRLVPEGFEVSAVFGEPGGERVLIGSSDGRVLGVSYRYRSYQLGEAAAVPELASLEPGDVLPLSDETLRERVSSLRGAPSDLSPNDFVERAGDDLGFRVWRLVLETGEPQPLPAGSGPVTRLTMSGDARGRTLAAMRESGDLFVGTVRVQRRLGARGGSEATTWRAAELEQGFADEPRWLALLDAGSTLVAVSPEGLAQRFDVSAEDVRRVGSIALLEADEGEATFAGPARGSSTLVLGTSHGGLLTFTLASDPAAPDGRRLVRTAAFDTGDTGVVSLGVGERDRTVAIGKADGGLEVRNLTSGKRIVRLAMGETGAEAGGSAAVGLAPAVDGVLAVSPSGEYRFWEVDPGYPEASWKSLFGRVHYEGRDRPEFVYQATAAEGQEPKYSLVPLIFGTLKATLFAMLFAVPVGVLAAVYTSEFLHPKVRRTVKPAIELMASLPSVVLGFVAAILLAPLVRDLLPGVLVSLGVVPFIVLLAASLWRLVPIRYARRLPSVGRLGIIAVVTGAAMALAVMAAGPAVERALFTPNMSERLVAAGSTEPVQPSDLPAWAQTGEELTRAQVHALRGMGVYQRSGAMVRPVAAEGLDLPPAEPSLRGWLDGDFGTGFPGWLLALTLPSAIVVWLGFERLLGRRWTQAVSHTPRWRVGLLEIGRLLALAAMTLALAAGLAWVFTERGLDPRDSIFGPFTQRNTLVVGLIMGFAIIPIIYTLSEDALRSVPESLRAGSLGAGATPWQTAVRVVLPVAGSGIFSAVMIGLGRAVGETMIVLMATGSTPTMDLNIFEGFRALSANIATEMPEVARGGTHYRVLFLCGLTLFAMTLVINTTAEFVRQRFRKRNAAL